MIQDEETGAWYQHRGRDFMVPLVDLSDGDGIAVGAKKGFAIWPGFEIYNIVICSSYVAAGL